MPRKDDVQVLKVRADLDGVVLDLVDCEEAIPFLRIRVEQALLRSGWTDLLGPALVEMEFMLARLCRAKAQINSAVGRLTER